MQIKTKAPLGHSQRGYPGGTIVKESVCQGRICKRHGMWVWPKGQKDPPGVGNGNALQYSWPGGVVRVQHNSVTKQQQIVQDQQY